MRALMAISWKRKELLEICWRQMKVSSKAFLKGGGVRCRCWEARLTIQSTYIFSENVWHPMDHGRSMRVHERSTDTERVEIWNWEFVTDGPTDVWALVLKMNVFFGRALI